MVIWRVLVSRAYSGYIEYVGAKRANFPRPATLPEFLASATALERAIAEWQGCEAALVFGSGYHANIGVLAALLRAGVVHDGAAERLDDLLEVPVARVLGRDVEPVGRTDDVAAVERADLQVRQRPRHPRAQHVVKAAALGQLLLA